MRELILRAFFDGGPVAACLAADDGTIQECNPAFARLFEYADPEQVRSRALDTLLVDVPSFRQAAVRAAGGAHEPRFETRGRSKEGRLLLLACDLRPADDPDLPGGILAWFTDLTERQVLQRELMQVPRSPTGARLVRAIAHDLGNMMMVIRGFTEVLVRELPEGGRGRGWVAQIRMASDRAAVLGEEMLAAARPPEPCLEELSPAAAVDAVLPLVRRAAGLGVTVEVHGPDDARLIRTNRDQFESVLLSLVSLAHIDRPRDTRLCVAMSWTDGGPSTLVVGVSGADPKRTWEARFPCSPASG